MVISLQGFIILFKINTALAYNLFTKIRWLSNSSVVWVSVNHLGICNIRAATLRGGVTWMTLPTTLIPDLDPGI